ncbi:hypothetical protein FZEAL_3771 [Fusarium zealandicum]|uniref:Vacuolar sorting protein Vps3844 C-terminal domain-containing protein n=1 Tax=Fusarium zealandicum TaxID=1053134 RepID=A0A8H4XM88_9HYPO|nr:hypothetical protein FZEAL_3771 [Fusarium zealandicum]
MDMEVAAPATFKLSQPGPVNTLHQPTIKMKLTIGLTAALASFAVAAEQAAQVYILRGSHPVESTTSLTQNEARLVLHQRLAAEGKGPSFRDISDTKNQERIVSLINKYGKTPAPLFSKDETASPRQLVVMVEGVPSVEHKTHLGSLSHVQPDFTISNGQKEIVQNDFYGLGVAKKHSCPLNKVVNSFEESCWNGDSTLATYKSEDSDLITFLRELPRLQKLAESGEMETTLVFFSDGSKTATGSDDQQELRRRQAETVMSSMEDTADPPAETTSTSPVFSSVPSVVPSCFKSEDSCIQGTANCSGHGACQDRYAKRDGSSEKETCFTCHCLSTVGESGSVTHWAGHACSKQDISFQFWLFAGFTLAMLTVLYLAIGMLFGVGEEKLPGVIGAGVSRSSKSFHAVASGQAAVRQSIVTTLTEASLTVAGEANRGRSAGLLAHTAPASPTYLLRARELSRPPESPPDLFLLVNVAASFGLVYAPTLCFFSGSGRAWVRTTMSSAADRPKPATAKWGAACAQCATAKAKCIRSNHAPGAKCDRRTAQIEERLNGLVNLLKASGGLTNADLATDTTCIPTEGDPVVSDQRKPSSKGSDGSFAPGLSPWAIPETYNSYAPPQCICRPASGDAPPPPASDEVLLNIYRTELQALHPFVVVPQNVTAATLKATRPFLMSSIRMVTSFRSLRSMRAQMYYLMQHIADHMLIRSERSLDLLMGILVIAAWYQYHCFMHAQLNNLIALAVTLVGELGLHRSPTVLERTNLMVVKPFRPERRTNEERRALLGVWFLSSAMSLGFSRIESMRYTKYIQECLGVLEREKEYETDVRLVYLVRIQHLTERISQLNSPDDPAEEVVGLPTAPLSAYVSAFQGELDRIRNGLPVSLKNDIIINTFLNTAALRLYEPPVLDTTRIISMSESLTSPTLGAASALDIFYQSRNALKKFFDNWLAIPISDYYCQTTPVAAQLVYALTMLGRWAKFAAPITLTDVQTPMPSDTSANNMNAALFRADSECSATGSSSKLTPAGPTPGNHEKDPQEYSQIVLREGTDPRLPAAVAALRTQIQSQSGLALDVSGILSGVCSRFEEANATFQVASSEPGALDHNLWSMSAIKVRITRAKLERWAEIVAAGTEALKLQDEDNRDTDMEDSGNSDAGKSAMEGAEAFMGGEMQADVLTQNWNGGTPWTSEMLQGVDPSIWFDGYLDWGAVIMNSMGNLEQ